MVQLIRPKERTNPNEVGVSISSAQAPGRAMANGGQVISQLSKEYFQQTLAADQTIQYSRAMSKATSAYADAATRRMQQTVDQDGNPTYGTLLDDVKNMAPDIKALASMSISDPAVRAQFEANFTEFQTGQMNAAFKEQRRQQQDFGKAELLANMDMLSKHAVSNGPEGLAYAENQVVKLADTAAASGLLSQEEAYQAKTSFSETARRQTYQNMIMSDPAQALVDLTSRSLEDLGIEEDTRLKLVSQASSKVQDLADGAQRALKEKERQASDAQTQTATLMELDVHDLKIGRAEIEQATQEGKINPAQAVKLIKQHEARVKTKEEKLTTEQRISSNMQANKSLRAFGQPEIDSHFENRVREAEEAKKGPLSLSEEAAIASTYGREVTLFSKKLNASILSGDPKKITEAITVYNELSKRGSPVLKDSAITKEAEEKAIRMSNLMKNAGLSPEAAVQKLADEAKVDQSPLTPIRKTKLNEYLKKENIEEYLNSELDLETFFGTNAKLSSEVTSIYTDLLRSSYLEHGDMDAAKTYATNNLKRQIGITEINGVTEAVINPPEKVFNMSTQAIKEQLTRDVMAAHPEANPLGLGLKTDSLSSIGGKIKSYVVVDGTGAPLIDQKTGMPERFYPIKPANLKLKHMPNVTPEQRRVIDTSVNFLQEMGVGDYHIAGMMASMQGEANFNLMAAGDPDKVTGVKTAFGLFQWRGDRLAKLKAALGPKWRTDIEGQIKFALSEPEGKRYLATKFNSPAEAAEFWVRVFERPEDPDGESRKRGAWSVHFVPGNDPDVSQEARLQQEMQQSVAEHKKLKARKDGGGSAVDQFNTGGY